ncbi:hypothetical protein [Bradyrhizobium canariense]|nr:hypothetical protein [Bradyrhizobium canariense]
MAKKTTDQMDMTGKQLLGLALICLVVVTAEAVSLRDQHIRERLKADNAW